VHGNLDAALFAEDGARALIGVAPELVSAVAAKCSAAGVPLRWIGETGGQSLEINGVDDLEVAQLSSADRLGFCQAVGL
jgi:phosphoribosylformylglycinamidine synthase